MAAHSRKHYELHASIMLCLKPYTQHDAWIDQVMRLVDLYKADNPRFDRQRFLKACGYAAD